MTMKEGRTPSGAEPLRLTDEEGLSLHGPFNWILCILKSQEPPDERRHRRKLERDEKAKKKKSKHSRVEED